jgi:hypothetical protein
LRRGQLDIVNWDRLLSGPRDCVGFFSAWLVKLSDFPSQGDMTSTVSRIHHAGGNPPTILPQFPIVAKSIQSSPPRSDFEAVKGDMEMWEFTASLKPHFQALC